MAEDVADARPPTQGGLLKSSALVGSLTMLSRILGLVRDIVVAAFVGATAQADASAGSAARWWASPSAASAEPMPSSSRSGSPSKSGRRSSGSRRVTIRSALTRTEGRFSVAKPNRTLLCSRKSQVFSSF